MAETNPRNPAPGSPRGLFNPLESLTMNTAPSAPAPPFAVTLGAFVARRALDEPSAAGLLGVPVYTLRKWIAGTRAPSAAAVRLLDVLGTLEAIAPAVLDALTPAAVPAAPKRPRGRPKVVETKASNQPSAIETKASN